MYRYFRPLTIHCREIIHRNFKFLRKLDPKPYQHSQFFSNFRAFHPDENPNLNNKKSGFFKFSQNESTHIEKTALHVQNLLKQFSNSSDDELGQVLNEVKFNDDLVLNLLKRHNSDWKSAFRLYNLINKGENPNGYSPDSRVCNEMIEILGKMKRFEDAHQVFDEMSKRGIVNERSYGIMVHRYAASHRTDDAIEFFKRRDVYGFDVDLISFQTLLMALCRYKHVEVAEYLFLSNKGKFTYDIKTWNIVLNGWSLLGNLHQTKRFWNEIISSKCNPDKVTYGIFINSLCKCGKISTAVKLFHAMWSKGCIPDVVICNNLIDGLCFKKRIPEALEIFREMNDKDCQPDVVTYNCLIKHLSNIGRMEVVSELLGQMEEKGGSCSPNARTYNHLLKTLKKPEEVTSLLERMERSGCKMTGDAYNLLLRLYMNWDCEEKVGLTWNEMVKHGMGPDQRSYTIMIHGLYDQGRMKDALDYFNEMNSKGMMPEPRTTLLVDAMNIKLTERGSDDTVSTELSRHAPKKRRRNIS